MDIYDVGTSDLSLRDIWDSYIVEPSLAHDALMACGKDDDWGLGSCCSSRQSLASSLPCGVVLRDRLMTDAALGQLHTTKPIKSEHSYSLLASFSSPSIISNFSCARTSQRIISLTTGSKGCQQPEQRQKIVHHHHHHHRINEAFTESIVCGSETGRIDVTDMEEECFPAISMNTASGRDSACSTPKPFISTSNDHSINSTRPGEHLCDDEDDDVVDSCPVIKGEPLSAPGSPACITDPAQTIVLEEKCTVAIPPRRLHLTTSGCFGSSDSEDDDEDIHGKLKVETMDVPCEEDHIDLLMTTVQELPPTPPSSGGSDSEGTVSASCSPERRDSYGSINGQNIRGFAPSRLYLTANGTITGQHLSNTRQPIHTPLISCQPKGSTGILVLTEEEKRTLIAEGYPIPTKLPLTKTEEKSLKKIRRKIKNKISAQESRRKKKEYMDGLERRVTLLTNENSSYREKVSTLETTNRQLLKELQRLQTIIQQSS